MDQLTPKQEKNLKRLAEVLDKGNLGVFEHLVELEETFETKTEELESKVESAIKEVKASVPDVKDIVEQIKGKDGKDGADSVVPGPQGNPGYTPVKNVDYFDGKDGYTPVKGKDYFDGTDGKDAVVDYDLILLDALSQIPVPENGKDGSPDTPDQVIEKINLSKGTIKKERVEGLVDAMQNIAHQTIEALPVTTAFYNGLRAKNLTIDGATAYQVGDTVHISGISGGGGSPGAPDRSIQFNDGGSFGGADALYQADGTFLFGDTPSTGAYGVNYDYFTSVGKDATDVADATKFYANFLIAPTITQNANVGGAATIVGAAFDMTVNGTGDFSSIQGNYIGVQYTGSGDVAFIGGAQYFASVLSGTVTSELSAMYLGGGLVSSAGVPIANALHVLDININAPGSVVKNYGILIDPIVNGVTNWNIYSGSAPTANNDPIGYVPTARNVFLTDNGSDVSMLNTLATSASSADVAALTNQAISYGSNNITSLYGIVGLVIHKSSGTLANSPGIYTSFDASAGGAVTNAYGIWVDSNTGTITNNYGLKIEDQTAGATDYAIYTGAGTVRFGGPVTTTSTITADGQIATKASLALEDPGAGTFVVAIQAPTLAAGYTLTLPVDDGNNLEVLSTNGSGVLSWKTVSGIGGANTALSNLASVAINTTLVSDTDNTDDLGTSSVFWRTGYFKTSIELGATDTTLTRSAAGVLAVEGVVIPSISSTNTLTNKRVAPRVVSAASYTTDTGSSLDFSTADFFVITAQAGALKFMNPGGSPTQGEKFEIRIQDDGTGRALTYDTQYRALGTALPTTTVAGKELYMAFRWNSTDTTMDLVSAAQQA